MLPGVGVSGSGHTVGGTNFAPPCTLKYTKYNTSGILRGARFLSSTATWGVSLFRQPGHVASLRPPKL